VDEKDLEKTLAAVAFTPQELEKLNRETGELLERATTDAEGLPERASALVPSLPVQAVKPASRTSSPAKCVARDPRACRR
jgi:hypothetical protein